VLDVKIVADSGCDSRAGSSVVVQNVPMPPDVVRSATKNYA